MKSWEHPLNTRTSWVYSLRFVFAIKLYCLHLQTFCCVVTCGWAAITSYITEYFVGNLTQGSAKFADSNSLHPRRHCKLRQLKNKDICKVIYCLFKFLNSRFPSRVNLSWSLASSNVPVQYNKFRSGKVSKVCSWKFVISEIWINMSNTWNP